MKLMRSNKTSCGVMLDSSSLWLMNTLIKFDSNAIQTIIHSLIGTCYHRFCHTNWSRRRHSISSARRVSMDIDCIAIFLGRLIGSQTKTRHLFKCIDIN
jgi:hypothetical protein